MEFLLVSLAASVILTVLLNVLLRVFPGTSRRVADHVEEMFEQEQPPEAEHGPRVHVWFPWRTMLLVSIGLTLLVNLFLRVR